MVIEQHKGEIQKTIELLKKIKNLSISSVNVYGSSTYEEVFVEGSSDIDIIVMCEKLGNLDLIASEISLLNLDFKEKRPTIIEDSLCKRIEFYVKYETITLDITICSGLIPSYESLQKDVWYDSFEALMGSIYLNSKKIYGEIPDYEIFRNLYYPFYSDELRQERLNILANRILETNSRLKKYIENNNPELVDHLLKLRKYFVKFLYIYYRKYYLSPEKHTYYQLNKILNLPQEEIDIICYLDGNIFKNAKNYIKMSEDYIEKFQQENINNKKLILNK